MWRQVQLAAALMAISEAAVAQDGWRVVHLHVSGTSWSSAAAVHSHTQAGHTFGPTRAALWHGSAKSFVSLHPPSAVQSEVFGMYGDQQVGRAIALGYEACLWHGTAASRVVLNPPGVANAECHGTDGVHQVGWGPTRDACMWTGTPESWVSLAPPGAISSEARAVHRGQQVGYVNMAGNRHASLWTGSPDWVDLHPPGAWYSTATGVHDGQQVGTAVFLPLERTRGFLWTGTPESAIDLTPEGALESKANAVHNGVQVGKVGARAALWRGSPDTHVDLDRALGPGYLASEAFGVWRAGITTYVVGEAESRAVMWVSICDADCDGDSALTAADLTCFQVKFALGDPYADCNDDLVLNLADFGCFQTRFAIGCP